VHNDAGIDALRAPQGEWGSGGGRGPQGPRASHHGPRGSGGGGDGGVEEAGEEAAALRRELAAARAEMEKRTAAARRSWEAERQETARCVGARTLGNGVDRVPVTAVAWGARVRSLRALAWHDGVQSC
jgi:hypothetical protein